MTRENRNSENRRGYPPQNQEPYRNQDPYQGQNPYRSQNPYQEQNPYEGQNPSQGGRPYQGQNAYQAKPPYQGQSQYQSQNPYQGQNPYRGQNPYQGQDPYRGQKPGDKKGRNPAQKGGGKKPKKKKTAGDIIQILLLVVAIGVFCYAAFNLVSIWLEYKKGTDEYSALEEYVEDEVKSEPESAGPDEVETEVASVDERGEPVIVVPNPIDFGSLQKINDEIIGWIKVTALDISYPIAQAEDNEYYLHTTFQNTYNFAGCIFMDYQNKSNFTDQNTLIYGHNMKNGSMFGKLKKFYEEGVYEKSPYFWIYTPDKIYKYEIFTCSEVAADSETYQLSFENESTFQQYLNDAVERSVVKSNVAVTGKDKIVTLSTCTGNDATRFIVQGKLIKSYNAK